MTKWIFVCGNVLRVHDLIDCVSQQVATAGKNVSLYIQKSVAANVKTVEIVKY